MTKNQPSLEDRTESFFRPPKIIGNTIMGVCLGIATTISPSFPFFLQLGSMTGYNTITPPNSKKLGRHLGELAFYTAYAFAIAYTTNGIIQYATSLIDKF